MKCLRARHKATKETIKPKATEKSPRDKVKKIETTTTVDHRITTGPAIREEEVTTTRAMIKTTINMTGTKEMTIMEANLSSTTKKSPTCLKKKMTKTQSQSYSQENKRSLSHRNSMNAEKATH